MARAKLATRIRNYVKDVKELQKMRTLRKRFPLLKQQLQTKIQSTQEGVETDDAEIEQTIAAAGVRVRMLRPGVTPSETQKDVQKMTNVKVICNPQLTFFSASANLLYSLQMGFTLMKTELCCRQK